MDRKRQGFPIIVQRKSREAAPQNAQAAFLGMVPDHSRGCYCGGNRLVANEHGADLLEGPRILTSAASGCSSFEHMVCGRS